MQTTILCADDVYSLSHALQSMKETALYQYITIREIEDFTTEEILEYANRPEYRKYVSSMFASRSISGIEKSINGLNAQLQELESKKHRHEKTMEKIEPGSSDISSLKPMVYHKHLEMTSITAIEDAIRKISQINYELSKITVSRTSLMDHRDKARTRLEDLMKQFDAITKDMLVVVRKYNLRKYLSSLIDTIESPDTDINDKERTQKELARLMKQFKLSSIDEAPDVVKHYVSPSYTAPISMKGDSDYRKRKPYTYLAKPGKKYYSIDVLKINRLIPQILSTNNTIEILLNQSSELTEKSSQLNKDIDSHEETMKKIVRGTPMERANISRSTTLDVFKQYRKDYIHVEDVVDTYYLTVKQQNSLMRARRLRDNNIKKIEELNHKIRQLQYVISGHEESIDFAFVEDAGAFARKIYFDIFKQTRVGIEDPVSKSMFFIKCSPSKNIIIDSLLQPMYSFRNQRVVNMIDALQQYHIDKTLYLTSSTRYIDSLTKWSAQSKIPINAKIVKFDEDSTVESFISSIRGEKQ